VTLSSACDSWHRARPSVVASRMRPTCRVLRSTRALHGLRGVRIIATVQWIRPRPCMRACLCMHRIVCQVAPLAQQKVLSARCWVIYSMGTDACITV